ncbi:C6 zinc finger domain-containing protein [Pochonia chlamydosporia 170]|uniref:C6 zinc finger domain-containing protein n=1 Tax=Pochonia chlamydosporia 170 TaxID=1380566 RepID=A0A179FGE5_METCM|nr:C6 zinc finger domain-containing protein [Pochonia chlamydosporia 170]OAQ64477.1 C6 zinc finger domain-containing protein [Pochonia chlamydosporia 170]
MAAACLSEVSPSLTSIGRQLQDQAALCLSVEARGPQVETSSLLALVMLGMSRSWHDPESVGQPEFEILAKLVSSSESFQTNPNLVDKQRKIFFHNSLVYWQMLLAFVTDREPSLPGLVPSQPQLVQPDGSELAEPRMPHPQTGIGIEVQTLVAKVGNLIRRERKRIRNRQFVSQGDIDQAKAAILDAEHLYSELCAIQLPGENAVIDSGDEMTPTDHLLKVAEAYRCTGLLQLYRNFPDLLPAHVSSDALTDQFINSSASENTCSGTNTGSQDAYLTCLALHILDLVHDIPVSSRSRSIQPLLFVSICSELSLGRSGCSFTTLQRAPVASIASSRRFKDPLTDLEILRSRRFVISRLSSFQNILAAKPIGRMLLLVKETWKCMEEGQNVYWMDVMMEKGYETLMG